MDMLYPGMPVQPGQGNNYSSPLKHATTPSINDAQNAMNMEKSNMVPDDEQRVEYRSSEDSDKKQKRGKKKQGGSEPECETCKKRRNKDISDDPGASLQSPDSLSKVEEEGNIRAHDHRHLSHEQANGENEGRDVVSQNMVIHYDVCPECGRPYIPGGTTATLTRTASPRERLGTQYQTGMVIIPPGTNVNTEF
ncbi:hypothetical protein FACS1894127_2150 [Clostridia bacterium]|nr:hypothetical protein FACS1894127_2150 [Clostridia bacterium]